MNLAIVEGKIEIITLLIQNGADVNLIDHLGWTPLCWSITKDKFKIVEILIANGANPNMLDASKISFIPSLKLVVEYYFEIDF